ncbi:hypothetical protein B0H10DRAFT_986073 [Mycena sp. CBHHK59/15]|nr:hypothetical protein B0H10DRAFT_986073 [Mycena sp. CBHHK59/15]
MCCLKDNTIPTSAVPEFTDRFIYNCNVRFGAGASALHIITSFESRRVLVSNIPASAQDADISDLIHRATGSRKLHIHRSPQSSVATATLDFDDASSAAQAALSVGNISIEGNILSGQLDLASRAVVEEGTGVLRGRKVNLTWYGPRASAFAHYPTLASAQEHALRLNGKFFDGYAINASFRPPPLLRSTHGAHLYADTIHSYDTKSAFEHFRIQFESVLSRKKCISGSSAVSTGFSSQNALRVGTIWLSGLLRHTANDKIYF